MIVIQPDDLPSKRIRRRRNAPRLIDRRGVRDVVSTSCRLHCYQFGNSNFTVCDVMIDVLSEQLVSRFV
jgi:hypothetical protein